MAGFYFTLSAEYVRSEFHYDPETGVFCRKKDLQKSIARVRKDGYMDIKCKSTRQLLHRIIWLHHHGVHADGFIDHINRDRADNRISNLRLVSKKQNNENKSAKKGKQLPKGVYYAKDRNKWQAAICSNYKQYHLGFFDCPQKAKLAYLEAASKIHTHNQG